MKEDSNDDDSTDDGRDDDSVEYNDGPLFALNAYSFQATCSDESMTWTSYFSTSTCSSYTATEAVVFSEMLDMCEPLDDYTLPWLQVIPATQPTPSPVAAPTMSPAASSVTTLSDGDSTLATIPSNVDRFVSCDPYNTSDTNDAKMNYQVCSFIMCDNEKVFVSGGCNSESTSTNDNNSGTVDGDDIDDDNDYHYASYDNTGSCSGHQFVRLFRADSDTGEEVQVKKADDGCGLCVAFKYESPSHGGCQTYSLRQGCYGSDSCSGQLNLRITTIGYVQHSCVKVTPTGSDGNYLKRVEFSVSQVSEWVRYCYYMSNVLPLLQ